MHIRRTFSIVLAASVACGMIGINVATAQGSDSYLTSVPSPHFVVTVEKAAHHTAQLVERNLSQSAPAPAPAHPLSASPRVKRPSWQRIVVDAVLAKARTH